MLVGEWSAAMDPAALVGTPGSRRRRSARSYADAQLEGYAGAYGWCFWTLQDRAPATTGTSATSSTPA